MSVLRVVSIGSVFVLCVGALFWLSVSSTDDVLPSVADEGFQAPLSPKGSTISAKEARRIDKGLTGAMTHRPADGYQPPRTSGEHPALTRFVDRRLPAIQRVSHDMFTQIPFLRKGVDCDAVVAVLLDREDDQNVRNEAITLLSQSQFDALPDILLDIYADTRESERFRSFAIQHIGDMYIDQIADKKASFKSVDISKVLHAALTHESVAIRRESLNKLIEASDPSLDQKLPALFADPAQIDLLDLTVYGLAARGDASHLAGIRLLAASEESDAEVRLAAIRALGVLHDAQSSSLLVRLKKTENKRQYNACTWALLELGK